MSKLQRTIQSVGPIVALLAMALMCSLGACTSEREPPAGAGTGHTTSSSSSATSAGAAGAGGAAVGGASAGGETAGAAGAGEAGGAVLPPDPLCAVDVALGAATIAFVSPTSPELAQALNSLTFAYRADPRVITLVLLASHGAAGATLAMSATSDSGSYEQAFPEGLSPTWASAQLGYGELRSATTQDVGYLRVVDDAGPVDIELRSLYVEASTDGACQSAVATLDATIPASQASVMLTVGGESATLADLAQQGGGGSGGGSGLGWTIRALCEVESVPFDYDSI